MNNGFYNIGGNYKYGGNIPGYNTSFDKYYDKKKDTEVGKEIGKQNTYTENKINDNIILIVEKNYLIIIIFIIQFIVIMWLIYLTGHAK